MAGFSGKISKRHTASHTHSVLHTDITIKLLISDQSEDCMHSAHYEIWRCFFSVQASDLHNKGFSALTRLFLFSLLLVKQAVCFQ